MTASKKVTIVDYEVGNLLSVRRALEHCGADVAVTGDVQAVRSAERLILPGVGAFGDCVQALKDAGLFEAVLEYATRERPFLGICVGMQMLFDTSEEFGNHKGLGLISGAVAPIPRTDSHGKPHKIPHIGWAALTPPTNFGVERWRGTILDGIDPHTCVYFVHSFTASPSDPLDRLADCTYNGRLVSAAVQRKYVTGTQFHPEKSGPLGLAIIRNFLRF